MIPCTPCYEMNGRVIKATQVLPRWVGGDENGLVEFIPVCFNHTGHWYDGIEFRLRMAGWQISLAQHGAHPSTSLLENNKK